VRPLELRTDLLRIGAAASLCALLAVLIVAVGTASAGKTEALETKLTKARAEAGSLSSDLQATTAELGSAEAEAAKAQAHEERLDDLLAEGRERAADLADKLAATKHRLLVEKARLRRSRLILADRLVAIYESGTPDAATLVLEADDYQDLVARNDYLRAITEADSALAERVAEVRAAVHREVSKVSDLEDEAISYDEQLEAARAEIA
jgi:peptidoglycan hydrolase CwlO-like protein